jgi:predicted transcriptional regulator
MKADRGLTVERMTELARVSRASLYRFEKDTGSRSNGRATDGGASLRSYVVAVGQ